MGCYLVDNFQVRIFLSTVISLICTRRSISQFDKGCRFVGVTFSIDHFFFLLLLLLHSFTSVQQFFAFQLSRELCFFLWGFSHSCVACGGFLSPHFLFSRLIGLHISMCCDSVSFDFIKPATTVARFIQHSCLFIF